MSSLHNSAADSASDITANMPTGPTIPSPPCLPTESASDMATIIATKTSPLPDLAADSTSNASEDLPRGPTLPTSSSKDNTKIPTPYTATSPPHLLDLTLETRTRIYKHLLLATPPIYEPPPRSSFCAYGLLHWPTISRYELNHTPQRSGTPIAILLTNKQIYAEALPILYINDFCIDLHPNAPVLTNDPRVVLGLASDWHLAHKYLVLGLSRMLSLRNLHISLIYAGQLRGFFVDASLPVNEEVGQVLELIYAGIPSWV
ncbi:hypothetical protein GRF29_112g146338 [Pseudopithomyces chartarum]|uniref:Uncharacterized protein n=1 Tax=Pseudopithomyces chartarum TaxID=1892770 RepID=A0AAN6LUN0_9PLEO|nr:hypothetical protein GRF29_112g146338 [Pseudopithomyces chartarum]